MFNANAEFVVKQLEKKGFRSLFVGGCVRDSILGIKPKDIDIATTALPVQVIEAFEEFEGSGVKTIPMAVHYGTVTVVVGSDEYQVTTLRRDVACFGRHANVEFLGSFKEDSNRRDFTFNALYMDLGGEIFDFHNGVDDLRNGQVKFINDPRSRIQEDYHRILRYFRFFARFSDLKENEEYTKIIHDLAKNLDRLSGERIRSEFLKILSGDNVYIVLKLMEKAGVMKHILDVPLDAASSELFSYFPAVGKLAMLSKDMEVEDLKKTLALSNKELKLLHFFQKSFSL